MAVHAASAASLPQEDPVCRSVAGPGETVRIDEGFQEKWSSAVSSLKILGELTDGVSEDLACKSGDMHPGQDQESTLIDNALQVAFSLLVIPANPAIAC